tara:strand:+ start:231 stop:1166 length:936 start_codon:yes stop_codon:yes gene_type:complete
MLKKIIIFCLLGVYLFSFKAYSYDGPLFDAMAQIDQTYSFKKAMQNVRDAGVSKIALFARSIKSLGENEKQLVKLREKNEDLIVLGAPKYFLHKNDIEEKFIERTIENIDKYNYAFIGEILFTHADKNHGRQHSSGEVYIDPLLEGNLNFLKLVSLKKIPVMTHWEFYNWERDWVKFSKLYSKFPEITFIIPHMGFGSIEQIEEILSKHPNVYMTISKKEKKNKSMSKKKSAKIGEGMLQNKVLKDDWKSILIKYQDKFMYATDAHKTFRWKEYQKIVKHSRKRILSNLPNDVAKKIAYQNAEKIYGIKIK